MHNQAGHQFHPLIDEFNNPTENAYTGWPDRLYVIDRKGSIPFKSSAGPFGFEPDAVGKTLERILSQ